MLGRVQRRVGRPEVEVLSDDGADPGSASRPLVVNLHTRRRLVFRRPSAHERECKARPRAVQLNRRRTREPEPIGQCARDQDDDHSGDDAQHDPQPASALLRLD